MTRTIPENPVGGERWAELFRGQHWRVYEGLGSEFRVVAEPLTEADARLLVEGAQRIAELEVKLAKAIETQNKHGNDGV